MKRRITLTIVLSLIALCSWAQKYVTEKTFVSFFSDAAIEDITAENKTASGIFNSATNDIAFSIPIKDFEFAKSLMKEHFNEKYMDTEKYPKSTFRGKISGFDIKGGGVQNVKATGQLTIHGQTRDIDLPGTIEKQGDKLIMKSKFIVKLEDYKVKIPQLMWQNIAEQVEVTVDFTFSPQ
ncbi:MAG TPA: YceI family protein [Chryseolinea sp.]|nr:YceI family protein [Chryseolinea sp.]